MKQYFCVALLATLSMTLLSAGTSMSRDLRPGTCEPERDNVRYGVGSGFVEHNPFVNQFGLLWKCPRGEWQRETDSVGADCSSRSMRQ